MNKWYRLDNAAKIFPTSTNVNNSSVFRISAVLHEKIDPYLLQKAVDHIYPHFPMLFVKMHQGVFWNYLDSNAERFCVKEETASPCGNMNFKKNRGYLLQVLFYHKRISVEVFHSLTDGTGAVEFLKTLIYYYLFFLGKPVEKEGKIFLPNQESEKENIEDSFAAYYQKKKITKEKAYDAYRIRGVPFSNPGTNVISGTVSVSALKKAAKLMGGTITSYLSAVLIYSMHHTRMENSKDNKPIVLAVPVNLRKTFPSRTLRNFFGIINLQPSISAETKLETIVQETTRQLKEKTQKERLQDIITGNVNLEKNVVSRLSPFPIKNMCMGVGFHYWGERKKSMTLSNLGNISLPKSMEPFLCQMESLLYSTAASPINCCICSLNDRLTITFSRSILEKDVIQYFFSYLAKQENLEVCVYSNDWGNDHA